MLIQQSQLMDNQRKKFANPTMKNFLPMRRGPFSKIKEIDKDNINARGFYYMFQDSAPRNFVQSPFATSEGGVFRDAGGSSYIVQNVLAITHRAVLSYTDQAQNVNRNSAHQEVSHKVVNEMDKRHLQALENSMGRQFWGNRTNEVARVSAINTGTRTITCNHAGNLFGVYHLEKGDRLHVFSSGGVQRVSGGGTSVDYLIVESVNPAAKTFVYSAFAADGVTAITAPALIANSDIIYPELGKDNAITGVESLMAASGAKQGLADCTVSKVTQGFTKAVGGQPLSVVYLRQATSAMRYSDPSDTTSKKNGAKFYCSAQHDAFMALGDALQPTHQPGSDLALGRTGISFEGIEIMFNAYVPRDVVCLLNASKLEKGILQDYGPVGGREPIMKQINGDLYDQFSIPFRGYWNMGCQTPFELGVWMSGFTTTGLSLGHGVD